MRNKKTLISLGVAMALFCTTAITQAAHMETTITGTVGDFIGSAASNVWDTDDGFMSSVIYDAKGSTMQWNDAINGVTHPGGGVGTVAGTADFSTLGPAFTFLAKTPNFLDPATTSRFATIADASEINYPQSVPCSIDDLLITYIGIGLITLRIALHIWSCAVGSRSIYI